MKVSIYLFILFFCVGHASLSQNRSIEVTYLEIRPMPKGALENIPEHLRDQVLPALKKKYQKQMTLIVDGVNSSYYEKEAIGKQPNSNINIVTSDTKGSVSVVFKNLTEKILMTQYELGGRKFLVNKKLPTIPWEVLKEKKDIGKYTAQKAVATIDSSVVTAWYTNEFPISTGPDNLWGLPGLILEVNFADNSSVIATEVILNTERKVEKPRKGKQITDEEFQELKNIYAENLREMYDDMEGTTIIDD
ncbi:MAG: GLPGLI family protein [Ekhidna sp.]|nr:GLPGLI family protein [Ekhidna sp.]